MKIYTSTAYGHGPNLDRYSSALATNLRRVRHMLYQDAEGNECGAEGWKDDLFLFSLFLLSCLKECIAQEVVG